MALGLDQALMLINSRTYKQSLESARIAPSGASRKCQAITLKGG